LKRTFAATLLILTACAAVYAQGARRAAAYSTPTRAKASAPRLPLVKEITADEKLRAGANSDEEVERLFDRNLLAQGGVATFRIKTRITRGRVEMSDSPNPGTFESYEKEPDKKVEVLNAPVGQFIDAADGGRRWGQSPWGVAVTLGGGVDESKEEGAPGSRSFKWRKYFSSARIKGRAVLDGREMVVLDATPKGARPIRMYFDAVTWLLRKQEFTPPSPRQENEFKAVVIDRYAEVDGVKVPTVFRQIFTKYTLTFRIYEVKHNVPIDDGLFRNPNGK
jgi:hypothetical protein